MTKWNAVVDDTSMNTRSLEEEVKKQKRGNLGIPLLPIHKMDPITKSVVKRMLGDHNQQKVKETDWQMMEVMLPILKRKGEMEEVILHTPADLTKF